MLNLLIAVLTSTYSMYDRNSKKLYLLEILKLSQYSGYSEKFEAQLAKDHKIYEEGW